MPQSVATATCSQPITSNTRNTRSPTRKVTLHDLSQDDEKGFAVITFSTKIGWMSAIVDSQAVQRLHFGYRTRSELFEAMPQAAQRSTHPAPDWWPDAQQLLSDYAQGLPVDLQHIPIATHTRTPFQTRVTRELLNVHYGETITYKELAQRAGSPQAARAVGNLMANNRIPLIIPCHRVVGSGGKLGGFSAPQGLSMKQRLLHMESSDSNIRPARTRE